MSVVFLHPLAFFAVILAVLTKGAVPLYELPLRSIPALSAWPPAFPVLPGAGTCLGSMGWLEMLSLILSFRRNEGLSAKGPFLFQCFPSFWGLKVFCFLPPTPKVGLERPSSSCWSSADAVEDALCFQ